MEASTVPENLGNEFGGFFFLALFFIIGTWMYNNLSEVIHLRYIYQ